MDEKIITQFEVNVLLREESTDPIINILKTHKVSIVSEKPIQKIKLSYDIKKQQYAFFSVIEIEASKESEKEIRKNISELDQVIRVLITEKQEKKQSEKKGGESPKKQSRLKSALQAMLPNEALEKKIEEILQ